MKKLLFFSSLFLFFACGEEIFVLDGVFEDEFGTYPQGSWLRSPSGSRHTPFSRAGCTIYVKTGQLPEPETV